MFSRSANLATNASSSAAGKDAHHGDEHVVVHACNRGQQLRQRHFKWATVNVCDSICDSADLCGIDACEFYGISPEATRRFIRALNYEQTPSFSSPGRTDNKSNIAGYDFPLHFVCVTS